ncbi:hypothetical protein [Marinobacter shengliensis]|uniref:Type II toxin-antitoxin system HicA family toxin n=1 Tax=Marinobacter shengliensis TaxID=1389223 RepID=A0ABV4WBQ3_9GAMM
MKKTDVAITIRKLADTTKLSDCHPELWQWLGLTQQDVAGHSPSWYRPPYVADIPHDIWQCTTKDERHYGRTLKEVAIKAGLKLPSGQPTK